MTYTDDDVTAVAEALADLCDYCRTTKACDAYRRGRADALREAADAMEDLRWGREHDER